MRERLLKQRKFGNEFENKTYLLLQIGLDQQYIFIGNLVA